MRRKLTAILMATFFVMLIGAIVHVNANRPHLLVLHSYDTDYVWTREINIGIDRVLRDQSWIQVKYHYMDTKRKSDDEHLRRAGIAARKTIEDTQPDVVIAFDDYAQKHAGSFFVNHEKIKIVFAAVNGGVESYNYIGASNVTGVYERKPVAAIKEAIILLGNAVGKHASDGHLLHAAMVADSTLSARRDADYLKSYDWDPLRFLGSHHVKDFEGWKKAILSVAKTADYILVGGYRGLKRRPDILVGGYRGLKRRPDSGPKEKFVPPNEVMKWTEENSPVPVIGINVFNTEDGAMLSVGVSPYEQGGLAAKMARSIIDDGKAPSAIPYVTSEQYVVSLRRSALERRKLAVPKIFDAFARATDNFHE